MTLTMPQIETARGNFYAPAFDILVSRRSLVHDLQLEVASVSVDSILEAVDRFTFVVNNAFSISLREFATADGQTLPEFFALGAPVEISMGYGDRRHLEPMVSGIITELSTSFPSSGIPQLTVSGFDHSYPLTKDRKSRRWPNKRDSDVVRELATRHHLTPRVEDTAVPHAIIEKSQESAEQFIQKLADRNGFEFFVVDKNLYFRRPANDKKGVIELYWGRGLVSFSPEIKLSEQVTEVEVHGWNLQTKEPIVGRARKGDEPGREQRRGSSKARASGAEYLAQIVDTDDATLRVREPVRSQQEADQRARAILKRRAEGFVGGRGESIGIPELKADVNVSLAGLGDFFSATFYVHQATHSIDTAGYRTTFEVKDNTI